MMGNDDGREYFTRTHTPFDSRNAVGCAQGRRGNPARQVYADNSTMYIKRVRKITPILTFYFYSRLFMAHTRAF